MKFDVSRYAGKTITVMVHVMTEDKTIRMGLDTGNDAVLMEADAAAEWVQLSAECAVPEDIKAAYIFIETDGAADFYVDDIAIVCGGSETVSKEETEDNLVGNLESVIDDSQTEKEELKNNNNLATIVAVAAVVICATAGIALLRKRK